MKKLFTAPKRERNENARTVRPPQFLPAASAIISMMYISGILILMLPENLCDRQRAVICAQDILSASARVAVLALLFAAAAEYISIRYPE